jgi:hypothetical protein
MWIYREKRERERRWLKRKGRERETVLEPLCSCFSSLFSFIWNRWRIALNMCVQRQVKGEVGNEREKREMESGSRIAPITLDAFPVFFVISLPLPFLLMHTYHAAVCSTLSPLSPGRPPCSAHCSLVGRFGTGLGLPCSARCLFRSKRRGPHCGWTYITHVDRHSHLFRPSFLPSSLVFTTV